MRVLAPTLMLALASCSAGQVNVRPMGGAAPAKGGDAYAGARQQLDAGNVALAIDGFRQALRANPQSVDALNALGVAYDRLGRFDLSGRYYGAALQLDPNSAKVRHNLALSIRMQMRMNKEEQLAENIVPQVETVAAPASVAQPVTAEVPVRMERVSAQEIVLSTRPPAKIGSVTVKLDRPEVALASASLHPFVPEARQVIEPSRLHVLNAVGRRGQAGRMRQYLAGVGWRAVSVGDSRRRLQRSVLLFPAGAREKAEALASTLPFRPRTFQSARVRAMVLVLGRNALRFDDGLRSAS